MEKKEENNENHIVKIPKQEYENLLRARDILLRQGYQNLPQEVIEQTKVQNFNRGAIAGLGIAALLYLLSRKNNK